VLQTDKTLNLPRPDSLGCEAHREGVLPADQGNGNRGSRVTVRSMGPDGPNMLWSMQEAPNEVTP
jgi:hypothetical protein